MFPAVSAGEVLDYINKHLPNDSKDVCSFHTLFLAFYLAYFFYSVVMFLTMLSVEAFEASVKLWQEELGMQRFILTHSYSRTLNGHKY